MKFQKNTGNIIKKSMDMKRIAYRLFSFFYGGICDFYLKCLKVLILIFPLRHFLRPQKALFYAGLEGINI
jgi:hypothetical protein